MSRTPNTTSAVSGLRPESWRSTRGAGGTVLGRGGTAVGGDEVSVMSIVLSPHNLIPFVIAGTMVIPVTLVGTFRFGELIMLALLPFYARSIMESLRNKEVAVLAIFGALWFTSQVFSDLYNSTPSTKFLRGWGNIILTVLNWLFYCGLYHRNYMRHVGALMGGVAGGLFGAFFLYYFGDKSQVNNDHLWDFYVSAWAFPLFSFVAFVGYSKLPWLVIACGTVYGILGNLYGGRSDGLIVLASTMFFVYLWFKGRRHRGRLKHTLRNGLILASVMITPFFFLYVSYAKQGILGKTAKVQIDMTKNQYNPFEVLLMARNESVIALDAIYEKPLLGHGSWANPVHLRKLYLLKMREIYGARAPKALSHDVLPVHSVLLGAWVFGGLMGFVFWVVAIYKTFAATNQLLMFGSVAAISIAVVYLPYFCWHVLFSPHAFGRFVWPASMAFLMFASRDRAGVDSIQRN